MPALLINQFVYLEAPGAAPLYAKVIEITGKTAVLRTLKDYTPPEELGLGRDGAQPRAELRAQPADGSGVRLHHADRHGRLGQDADGARRRAWRR